MAWRPNQHRVLTPVSCGAFVESKTATVSFPGKKPVPLSPEMQRKVMQQQAMLQQQAMQQQVMQQQAAAIQQQAAMEQRMIQQAAIEQAAIEQRVIQQAAIHHVIQQQAIQEHVMLQHHVMQQQVIQQQAMQPPVVQQSHYQSLTHSTAPIPAVPQVSGTFARSGIGEEFMELNSLNAFKFVSLHGEILVENSPSQWHQIIIKTLIPASEKTSVVAAINKRISPQKLIPYFFRMENNHISFFVNMCGLALKTLCRRDLKVPYHSDRFDEIEMTLKLFSKNFNLPEALKEVVSARLDSQKKFLDLSYINTIPEIQEMLFDPSDNWHIVDQLLRVSEVMAPSLVCLRLAGNGITTLTHLWNFLVHSKWKTLRSLDLSDNAVKSTGSVSLSRVLLISEVYLDRNPLCQMLKRDSYISAIKATFPRLAKLDGTYLHTSASLPYWKPNYIVSSESRDAGEFADQFIEHFFSLYDDADRMKLRGMYHKNAFFSLAAMYLDAQLTTPNARLSGYTNGSRNLFHFSDAKKARSALTRGSEKILERLSALPTTLHDPYSFTVDLTLCTPKCAVLTVSGVFRDIAKEKSSVRHFTRTFVLTGGENDQYQITNDILYVSNAATREAEESFKFLRPPKKIKKNKPQRDLSECEKESMTGLVQQLTNMSAPWSRKCLEDTDWDLKEALQIFVQLYEMSKIPKSAFVTSK